MAFKASFKFSDSREFDVLTWRVKFNRDVDPKGRPASDIYGGTIYVEIESTPDTIVLDKMFKQYQPVNGNIVFNMVFGYITFCQRLRRGGVFVFFFNLRCSFWNSYYTSRNCINNSCKFNGFYCYGKLKR